MSKLAVFARFMRLDARQFERAPLAASAPAPLAERIAERAAVREREAPKERAAFVSEYVDRLGLRVSDVKQEWSEDFSRVKLFDGDGWQFAKIKWNDGVSVVDEFLTPAIVSSRNVRIGFSCAISFEAETPSDGSMTGNLARGRSKFCGQMSTN